MSTLKERVKCALDNAIANGCEEELRAMSSSELTVDLISCDADLEDEAFEDVLMCVMDWQDGRL